MIAAEDYQVENVKCALCGQDNPQPLFAVPDLLLDRPTVIAQFVRCKNCGLIYQNPRPTFEAMQRHYPPEYTSYSDPLTCLEKPFSLRKLAVLYGLYKRTRFVTKHKSTPGRLLDVGCATGAFLWAMQKRNWEVYGVEISQSAVMVARNRYQLEVFHGTLQEAAFPTEFFDVVTMWDVLEHLHDLQNSLQEVYRILKPNGLFLARVPNFSSLDAKWFKSNWAGLDAPRHLYVFTPQTLTKLVEKNGFSVRERSGGIGGYPTFVLSILFSLTAQKKSKSLLFLVRRILLSSPAVILSAPFFYILERLNYSALLIVVAEKKHSSV